MPPPEGCCQCRARYIPCLILSAFHAVPPSPPRQVALLSRLLGDPLPPRTAPALGLSLVGTAMTVLGGESKAASVDWRDGVGLLCAFGSAFLLACYMILVKKTGYFLLEQQVMALFRGQIIVIILYHIVKKMDYFKKTGNVFRLFE